jgi:hypothetical protein
VGACLRYATTIRDSKRCRERDFLKAVHECVERGGKVLIPVFALGRAQELCILLDTYWQRMNLGHVPIYFTAGLSQKANYFYKLFIHWTNQKIKQTFVKRCVLCLLAECADCMVLPLCGLYLPCFAFVCVGTCLSLRISPRGIARTWRKPDRRCCLPRRACCTQARPFVYFRTFYS